MILAALRFWVQLPWLQRRVIVRTAIWLGVMDLGLRFLGFRRLLELVPPAAEQASTRVPGHISMYVAALEIVAKSYPVPAHCLHKSMVLHFWMRREGLPSELRIGVRKDEDELKAHAWVELGGQVVNDDARAVTVFQPLSAVRSHGIVWASPVADVGVSTRRLLKVEG